MRLTRLLALLCPAVLCAALAALPASGQEEQIPKNIADSVGEALKHLQGF